MKPRTHMHARVQVLVVGGIMSGAGACGPMSGTGGRAVDFELAFEVGASIEAPFTSSAGWEIQLDEADIALGPVWLYENAPAQSRSEGPDSGWLGGLHELLIPTAWAHAGDDFFDGGRLLGEFLEQRAVSLRDGDGGEAGAARGVAGNVRSVSLVLDPPSSVTTGDAEALGDAQMWVSGRAQRELEGGGLEVVDFYGHLRLDEDARELRGIPANFDLDDDGRLVLRVDARRWLDEAQFDRLETPDAEGRYEIGPNTQPAVAWTLAARNANSYAIAWAPAE